MMLVDHLYEDAKGLSVRQHNHIFSLQYLIGCYHGSHPSICIKVKDKGKDIYELKEEVQCYQGEPLDQETYLTSLSGIQTDAVTEAISNYSAGAQKNNVYNFLLCPPPYC